MSVHVHFNTHLNAHV